MVITRSGVYFLALVIACYTTVVVPEADDSWKHYPLNDGRHIGFAALAHKGRAAATNQIAAPGKRLPPLPYDKRSDSRVWAGESGLLNEVPSWSESEKYDPEMLAEGVSEFHHKRGLPPLPYDKRGMSAILDSKRGLPPLPYDKRNSLGWFGDLARGSKAKRSVDIRDVDHGSRKLVMDDGNQNGV